MSESIKVIMKQKSITMLVDYCLEEKIEFSVRPQAFPDTDWEFDMIVKDIKTAVMTGMFLRENRIEMAGTEAPKAAKKPVATKKQKEEEEKPSVTAAPVEEPKAETEGTGLF
jgi:hypothetical protein